LAFVLPQPTWHGHIQAFYRLRDASEFLLVDLVVMKESSERRFLQPERHGRPSVLFDKAGLVVPQPIEPREWIERLTARLSRVRVTFPLFQCMVTKEINRGNIIEALAFYHGYTLRPLIEVLRMRYAPYQHDFHTHYLQHDLPAGLMLEVEALFCVVDLEDLAEKHARAIELYTETLDHLDSIGFDLAVSE
jgi:hypothetical protein